MPCRFDMCFREGSARAESISWCFFLKCTEMHIASLMVFMVMVEDGTMELRQGQCTDGAGLPWKVPEAGDFHA